MLLNDHVNVQSLTFLFAFFQIRKHVAEAIKKEVYSPIGLRNLFGLRCLESLTQADDKDSTLSFSVRLG